MRYDTIQADVTTKLAARLATIIVPDANGPRVDVVNIPDTEKGFIQPFSKPRVTVFYAGSDFEFSNAQGWESEPETVKINVHIGSRAMYGDLGAHAIIAAVKRCLVGYRPTDCGQLELKAIELMSMPESGTFYYLLRFECHRVAVEELWQEGTAAPNLQKLTYKTPFNGDIEIP
jgi:hypothetical protein